jgi:hypothetical protein
MTQTLTLPGVALQWKAVGPFNQPLVATVSIKPHFPFGGGARNTGSVVFPATNASPSTASFFSVPLVGVFDLNGRLVNSTGNALVVPALDSYSVPWVKSPTLYEVQIDINGMSSQRGIFVAFATPANNFAQGHSGLLLADENASTSAMIGSGSTYTGTVYLGDTVVSPLLVNQSVSVGGFTAVVNSINLLTNSMAVTTTAAQSALTSTTFYWGNTVNLGVDLSQCVNWL